jgi:hypothetical protein
MLLVMPVLMMNGQCKQTCQHVRLAHTKPAFLVARGLLDMVHWSEIVFEYCTGCNIFFQNSTVCHRSGETRGAPNVCAALTQTQTARMLLNTAVEQINILNMSVSRSPN